MNNMNFCSWTPSFHGSQSSDTTQLCWKKDYKAYFNQHQCAADSDVEQPSFQQTVVLGNPAVIAPELWHPRQSGSPGWRCFSSTSVEFTQEQEKQNKTNTQKPPKKSSASQAAEPRPQHRAEQRGFIRAFDGKSSLKLFLLEYLSCFLTKRQIFHGSIWVFLCF